MASSADALPVDAFAHLARDFCAWCEGNSLGLRREATASQWLTRLYGAAINLPKVDPENEQGLPDIEPRALERATQNLACFNGWYYREVLDPDPASEESPGMGDIGDDLLDVYQDVRRGLSLWDHGQIAEALWHWEFCFRTHWGRHAAGAILALHCMWLAKRVD
jgi:hypothetical protein